MYKKISISDIIGSFFISNSDDIKEFTFEKCILIENNIAKVDSFIQIDCSISERRRAEYLGEDEIHFSSQGITFEPNLSNQVKNRFIRCYYGLDDDCKKTLNDVKMTIADGER